MQHAEMMKMQKMSDMIGVIWPFVVRDPTLRCFGCILASYFTIGLAVATATEDLACDAMRWMEDER